MMAFKVLLILFTVLFVQVTKTQYQWSLQQYIEHRLMHNNPVQYSQMKRQNKDVNFAMSWNQWFSTVNANHDNIFRHNSLHNGTRTDNNKITANFNMPLDWAIAAALKSRT